MYVIQTRPEHSRQQLHELDRKGLRLAQLAYPNDHFEVISGLRAHHWVKNGWPHSTPLYVDQGRIRYARDAR